MNASNTVLEYHFPLNLSPILFPSPSILQSIIQVFTRIRAKYSALPSSSLAISFGYLSVQSYYNVRQEKTEEKQQYE
eukprot:scaffold6260_cov209-Alexandrium_tamarense.AAC.4